MSEQLWTGAPSRSGWYYFYRDRESIPWDVISSVSYKAVQKITTSAFCDETKKPLSNAHPVYDGLFYFETRFLVETQGFYNYFLKPSRAIFVLCLCLHLCRIDPTDLPHFRLACPPLACPRFSCIHAALSLNLLPKAKREYLCFCLLNS